jgi:predicted lipoprotein with Yx(FWY)xxD motif
MGPRSPKRLEISMKRPILPALAVVAAVAAAACGGSSSSGSGSTASSGGSSSSGNTPSSSGGGYNYGSQASTPAPSSGGAAVKTASGSLGTFLVDSSGRALYLWKADKSSMSTCNGACAQAWPPLTTKSKPKAGGGVKASLLGTSKRSDGTLEVTYAGHPLYYYAGDTGPGMTSGQANTGFGAYWFVVAPTGHAITKGDKS